MVSGDSSPSRLYLAMRQRFEWTKDNIPQSQTDIKPHPLVLPAFGWFSIVRQEHVRQCELYAFPSRYESVCGGMFGKVHGDGVYLWFVVVTRCHCTYCGVPLVPKKKETETQSAPTENKKGH